MKTQHVLSILVCGLVLIAGPAEAADQPAQDMSWVMDYEIPQHDCQEPTLRRSNQNADQISRYQRKLKRYRKCVGEYQQQLIADHQQIITIAQQSATPEQTPVVVEKLQGIQAMVVELGQSQGLEVDPLEIEQINSVGNRPSI
jgi:hypothetical protein